MTIPLNRILFQRLFFSLLLTFAVCGCEIGGSLQKSRTDQLQEADRLFERERFDAALMKYTSCLLSSLPEKTQKNYALYKQGLCYFMLDHYSDARDAMKTLMRKSPGSEYEAHAREIIQKCELLRAQKNQREEQQQQERNRLVSDLERDVIEESSDPEQHFQLANAYWRSGNFNEAVIQYEIASSIDPAYRDRVEIRSRIRIDSGGRFTLRNTILDLGGTGETVTVRGGRLERISRDNRYREDHALRFSGFVENTGLGDVRNVHVEVTLLNAANTVEDVRTAVIGKLQAGTSRAFTVLFTRYEGSGYGAYQYTTEVFYDE